MAEKKAEKLVDRLGDPEHTLYLIDISSFIFRAFFAIRPLHTRTGEPTNAVYGVATMLAKLAQDANPEYLAVVYDSKEPSFRKQVYAEYKANRSAPPDELIPQFARIEELIHCFEICSYRQSGVEADDLIATLTKRWCKAAKKNRVVIVSGDKDLMQLVDDRVQLWDTMTNKVYGRGEVIEKFGVPPEQMRDYLGMVGDSSDNIPGIPGVGPKTAVEWLKTYQNLAGVLKAAATGKIVGKKGEIVKAHEKDALLSAELATVKEDLPVELDPEKLKYQFQMNEACETLLKSLDFHSLAERWQSKKAEPSAAAQAPAGTVVSTPSAQGSLFGGAKVELRPSVYEFKTINTQRDFQALLKKIEKTGEFGFDLETTSLNPRLAEIVGIAICTDPAVGCYIPVGHKDQAVPQLPRSDVLEALAPYLEDPKCKKIGQNLKYDWSVLRCHGLNPDGIGADTMVAAYVLSPEGRHNLETLARKYLDYDVLTYEQVCGKGKDQICFDELSVEVATRYSGEDALIAVQLWDKLRPELEKAQLMDIFARVDLPLVNVLSKLECQGVCVDGEWLEKLARQFSRELKAIEERIQAYAKAPINLNSPRQLGQLLFEELKLPAQGKTKTGYSTDAQVLDALSPLHEVPRLLLEYREISKLKGTYVDPLPGLRDPKTGKIHASFHQTVAATGRLSSSDPNLQNIPIRTERGQLIRKAFIPCPGNLLVSADYSQIELRLLAHMSGDPELTRSFLNDEDVHRRTASEIFDVAPDKVDDRQRGIAKAINFGLMYGKTAFGLSQELKISRKEAQDVITRYFARYHGVKKFLDGVVLEAQEKGYVCTILGRKRYLPEINSANAAVRANAARMAMNAPIQGTAADLMKLAMEEIDRELAKQKLESNLIIQVHDEVLLDCPKKEAERTRKLVVDVMENVMKLSVPLRVNSAIGENWMEL